MNKIRTFVLYRNLFFVSVTDLLLILLSVFVAFMVRFDSNISSAMDFGMMRMILLTVALKPLIFYYFDLYKGMWRYTGVFDLLNVIKASTVSTLFISAAILFTTGFIGLSRSVFLMDWCLTIFLIFGFRLSIRLFFEKTDLTSLSQGIGIENLVKELFFSKGGRDKKKILIIGAGDCGEKILREIRENSAVKFTVAGFLDDDPSKIGKKIHGVLILNAIDSLESVIERTGAEEILIAVPSANAVEMRKIIGLCEKSGLAFKTIPNMGELINGNVTVSSIREISFRDLLGREPVRLDQRKIGGYLKDQTVMVTGAGGSIGTELCRQICRYKPATIILFERAETALFNIDLELKRHFKGIDIIPVLGDVQERHELEEVLGHYLPHTLFHAAAYKHVPMLEMFPWKAVTNNITGTVNVVEAAAKFRVGRFVFVSTDKAVKPSSIMGASKRIAEIYVQNQNVCSTSETRFMTVRFGNVAGSAGSVVPLFKQQIKEGGPVTVTHRDATRFFMTIPEACQLILQSAAMGDGGEIFLLEMGRPVKIDDLARDMIRMSGFEPDNEIIIKYTGLRPGEKISEELMIEGEGVISTEHDKIMVLSGKECNLNLLNGSIEKLEKAAEQMDGDRIGVLLFDDKFDGKNNQCDYQPKPEKCSLV